MTNTFVKNQREIIRELLDSEKSIGVIIGHDQNIDTVAAGLGLLLILSQYGKDVQIVSQKDVSVEVSNLFGVDQIKKSFDGLTKTLTISVPYREGEIEKVSYNIEQDRLNVNLFAESNGINFSENDIEYIRKGSSPNLIITVGVENETELSNFVDAKSVKTIHLDKNPVNSLMGDVALIDPTFSSLSEIVASLVMELGLPYDADGFQNLMDGITYATRNFTLQTTSPFAFETAGFLLQNGARRKAASERQAKAENRSFPREDYFLNQRQRPQAQQQQARQPKVQRSMQNSPVMEEEEFNPQENNGSYAEPVSTPNINKASGGEMSETEVAMPDEIPDDWFLPKVFKGSKKGN